MNILLRYWKRILSCVLIIVLTGIILCINQNVDDKKVLSVEEYRELYEDTIEPVMLVNNVSTTFTIEDENSKVQLRYALSSINSLVSYYSSNEDGVHMTEVWNNMEKYYLRVIDNDTEDVYEIDSDKEGVVNYVYNYYITAMSYLGVASKERIISFEQVDENTYIAKSVLEDSTYSLRFVLEDGVLTHIYMFEDMYDDKCVSITFDTFYIDEQSKYEDTDKVCDDELIDELLKY